MSPFGRVLALFCLFVPTFAAVANAQTTEADIKTRLMNKPLYLRGYWSDDNLRFDPTGHLTTHSDTASFTVSGFELGNIILKKDKLLLEGRRVGLEFSQDQSARIPLNVGKPKEQKDERIRIEIAAPHNRDYTEALDAIFADGLAQLAPTLPDSWQRYARQHFYDGHTSEPENQSFDVKPRRVGGNVTPPRVLHHVDPKFPLAARRMKYTGSCTINLWVGTDGLPTHLSIVRPCGLGLDERGLEAIQQYTFAPSTQDSQPVTVELNIEVNFQTF